MIVLLSPAKDIATEVPRGITGCTQPVLLEHSAPLIAKLRGLSEKRLMKLMGISPKLAALNHGRYASWSTPFTTANARPAAFVFNGEAYRGLSARTLEKADLGFAQHHLRILSGLYGVLRPLDLVQDYRLEMGTPLTVGRAKNLYAYWRKRITERLLIDLDANGSNTVINLASSEYSKAVDTKALGARIIAPVFKDRTATGYKMVMVFAKHQRGAMARHMITHRILDAEKLKGYTGDGYRFEASESSAEEWVFLRDRK